MNCPKCKRDIGLLKKYQLIDCKCGVTLMCVEVNKKLIIEDVTKDKGH